MSDLQDHLPSDAGTKQDVCVPDAATGHARALELLAVSELFRRAWQEHHGRLCDLLNEFGDAVPEKLVREILEGQPMGHGPLDRNARKALGPLWSGWQERAEAAYAALASIASVCGVEPSVPELTADAVRTTLETLRLERETLRHVLSHREEDMATLHFATVRRYLTDRGWCEAMRFGPEKHAMFSAPTFDARISEHYVFVPLEDSLDARCQIKQMNSIRTAIAAYEGRSSSLVLAEMLLMQRTTQAEPR